MKLKTSTLLELKNILKEEFNFKPNPKELEKFAFSLVGYFDLLMKVDSRHKFGNSPDTAIDISGDSVLDKEEVK